MSSDSQHSILQAWRISTNASSGSIQHDLCHAKIDSNSSVGNAMKLLVSKLGNMSNNLPVLKRTEVTEVRKRGFADQTRAQAEWHVRRKFGSHRIGQAYGHLKDRGLVGRSRDLEL